MYESAMSDPSSSALLSNLGFSGSVDEYESFLNDPSLGPLRREYLASGSQQLLDLYNSINSTTDPYYRDQLLKAYSNYRSQQFSPSALQYFGESFGDFSARRNFQNQALGVLGSETQRILEGLHTQDYMSEASQAERLRLAGQNPDLNGGQSLSPSEPGNIDQPENGTGVVNDTSSVIPQIAQMGISFVSQCMEFGSMIQQLRYGSLQNVAQDLSNHSSAMNLIAEEVMNGLGIKEISDVSAIDDSVFLDFLGGLAKDNSFNRSTKRVLNRYYDTMKSDTGNARLHTAKMELAQRYFNARKGVATEIAHPLFDENFEKYVGNIGEKWSKLVFELEQIQVNYDKSRLTGSGSNGLGNAEYLSNKTAYEANTLVSEQQKAIEGFFTEIYKDLSNGDKWYHKIGLVLLPLFRALVTNLLSPSVSMSVASGGRHDIRDTFVHGIQ